jgi:collagen triple helix repeat protein
MIKLVGGNVQSLAGLAVPSGKLGLTLSGDAVVIAPPFGFVASSIPTFFQFDATANLLGTCQIWSNAELNPATQYTVIFYDQDGARINQAPLYWQFTQTAGSTVDIGTMVPFANPLAVIPLPGPAGAAGAPGRPGSDGEDGDAGQVIPGPQGAAGATGSTGSTGLIGPQGIAGAAGIDGDDGLDFTGLPSGITNRASLAPDAKGWVFLGTATGATVTVGPIIWTGQYRQFKVNYSIAGYNGGTPVGRFLCGAGTPSTTGLTNGSNLADRVAGTTPPASVSAPSVPGMPLSSVVGAGSDIRDGWIFIDGASGSLKRLRAVGANLGTVAAPPKIFDGAGVFSDLGTNLLLQQAQLTVYDTLASTTVSAQTFLAGTYLSIWGRFND